MITSEMMKKYREAEAYRRDVENHAEEWIDQLEETCQTGSVNDLIDLLEESDSWLTYLPLAARAYIPVRDLDRLISWMYANLD